ncbi:GMP/IMP nucleotidase [Eionea flava]
MINWNSIDTVLLDMDGTLLDLHYDNYFWSTHLPARYAEIKQLPLAEAQATLQTHIRSLEGTLNWYCLDYWSDALDIDIGALKAEPEISHKIRVRPDTLAFLQFLHEQGKHVILATNAHPIGLNMKLASTAITPYLHHIITSHQFQVPKEERLFWERLAEHLEMLIDYNPAKTLFIDDNLQVLKTAKDYGIAYTLGIHQPDSCIERTLDAWDAIHHFSEIMTIPTSHHG